MCAFGTTTSCSFCVHVKGHFSLNYDVTATRIEGLLKRMRARRSLWCNPVWNVVKRPCWTLHLPHPLSSIKGQSSSQYQRGLWTGDQSLADACSDIFKSGTYCVRDAILICHRVRPVMAENVAWKLAANTQIRLNTTHRSAVRWCAGRSRFEWKSKINARTHSSHCPIQTIVTFEWSGSL